MDPEGIEPPSTALEAVRLTFILRILRGYTAKGGFKLFPANLYKQNARQIPMVKKKVDELKVEASPSIPTEKDVRLEHQILENLVELQKVHTNLAEKFDKLAEQITLLLALFEKAAHSFTSSPGNQVAEKDREFLDKVDKLLEQNKTIAKALTLVEERVRERMYGTPPRAQTISTQPEQKEQEDYTPSPPAKPLPRF